MSDLPPDSSTITPRSRWSNVAWVICSLLLVGLVVGAWFRMNDEVAGANLANAIIAGDRPDAPTLPAKQLADDGAPGLPAWYGTNEQQEILVVNWWASWCGPCEDEAQELQEIADEYDGRVTVVGMNPGAEDLESDARQFVKRHKLTFSIVRASRSDKDAWGVSGFPETYIVGADGRMSAFFNGQVSAEDLREVLDVELEKARA